MAVEPRHDFGNSPFGRFDGSEDPQRRQGSNAIAASPTGTTKGPSPTGSAGGRNLRLSAATTRTASGIRRRSCRTVSPTRSASHSAANQARGSSRVARDAESLSVRYPATRRPSGKSVAYHQPSGSAATSVRASAAARLRPRSSVPPMRPAGPIARGASRTLGPVPRLVRSHRRSREGCRIHTTHRPARAGHRPQALARAEPRQSAGGPGVLRCRTARTGSRRFVSPPHDETVPGEARCEESSSSASRPRRVKVGRAGGGSVSPRSGRGSPATRRSAWIATATPAAASSIAATAPAGPVPTTRTS